MNDLLNQVAAQAIISVGIKFRMIKVAHAKFSRGFVLITYNRLINYLSILLKQVLGILLVKKMTSLYC